MYFEMAKDILALLLDVDGVMTSGDIYFTNESSQEIKRFNVYDGQGIQSIQQAGILVCFITKRNSEALAQRAADLSVEHCYQGVSDKIIIYNKIKSEFEFSDKNIAYVGDDLVDIEVIKAAGIGFATRNAAKEVIKAANLVTDKCGGNGAVRQVCDFILSAKNYCKHKC